MLCLQLRLVLFKLFSDMDSGWELSPLHVVSSSSSSQLTVEPLTLGIDHSPQQLARVGKPAHTQKLRHHICAPHAQLSLHFLPLRREPARNRTLHLSGGGWVGHWTENVCLSMLCQSCSSPKNAHSLDTRWFLSRANAANHEGMRGIPQATSIKNSHTLIFPPPDSCRKLRIFAASSKYDSLCSCGCAARVSRCPGTAIKNA